MRRARAALVGLASTALVAGGLAYSVADAFDRVPGVLTVRPEPTPPPPPPPAPGASPVTALPAPVLDPAGTDAPLPARGTLAASLASLLADPALGTSRGASVVDLLTGEVLLDVEAAVAREPASTAKLLTGAAALRRVGPQATLATRAVTGVTPDEVVLVAGGDVLLAAGVGDETAARGHAGLADLAQQTAQALAAAGRSTVAVHVDDSLFSGPPTARGWSAADVDLGFVAPVTALAVDAGRLEDENYAPRADDPSLAAAETFAALLGDHGVRVVGDVVRAAAPPAPEVLGEVHSAPVADVVRYMLASSDNTVAEALARLVAVEVGRPATFADGAGAVLDEVAALGVDVRGAVLADGSGLAEGSALAPALLTELLTAAASAEHEELRSLVTGLPVAGLDGTLLERFAGDGAAAGVGTVRAKTGSLSGVTTLAGTVTTLDGRVLAFAVLADDVPGTAASREVVDRIASTLAACGCR
ncbi:MAG: D-alanyl-D-alanine carboxypeptidase/D-alanyl-D-alanine-endopeptidase [Actinomycetes bacterium]